MMKPRKQESESRTLRRVAAFVGKERHVAGKRQSVADSAGSFLCLDLRGGHMSIHFRIICEAVH